MTNQSPSDSQTNRVDTGASRRKIIHEAIENFVEGGDWSPRDLARYIEEKLAAQDSGQGEAVAWRWKFPSGGYAEWHNIGYDNNGANPPLGWIAEFAYTHPPKPAQVGEKWRAVTDADAVKFWLHVTKNSHDGERLPSYERIIEAMKAIGAVVPAREGE